MEFENDYGHQAEDVVLPDDFGQEIEDTPAEPQAEETILTEDPPTEEETPTEEVPTEETAQAIKIKYNKEEMEIPIDEAVPLVQKGMNYDKLQEKLQALESDPRLQFVEELASESGMSVEEYLDAAREFREQQKLNELIQQNIPEDLAREIMENRKFRQDFESKQKQQQEEEQKKQEYQEFFESFPDVKPDSIPPEVWQMHQQGVPLKYAYMQHDYNQLKEQVQVLKQNKENKQKAPVQGVTQHGTQEVASEDPFMQGFNSI